MKTILSTIIVVLLLNISFHAQAISDNDRRPFENLSQIKIDVDGDGKPDTIQPRTYQITIKRSSNLKLVRKRDIQNWIAFDLMTTKGRRINSFFKYNYGTAEQGGSYWVYALIPTSDINRDKKTDLVFYSGDDTSDDTITLISRGNRFIIHKKKHTKSEDW
jgi:predicted dithiol-disulfide oxidoreductase (DUF899 family)